MAYRIPIINEQDLFLDVNRQPLVNGKVEVLDPISTDYLNIYTYTDAEYTIATNPIRLDVEGRAPQTYFSDRLSYARVYKYLGVDENNEEVFEFVRDYMCGEDENAESREYVVGIEALKDLDPSTNSSVNVIGYYDAYDCPLRTYIWDEDCQQEADGGYIIASDVSSTGRWILLFSGEYLPSTYYGVYPGSEANINSLLSYVDTVGSNSMKTAPGVYFVTGSYTGSTVALLTTKKLLIDNGSSFTHASITSSTDITVIGGASTNYITNLYGVKSAHSSWYKSLQGFLDSGAKELIFDNTVYFTSSAVMTKNTTLNNVHLVNQTGDSNYIQYLGFGSYTLTLDSCIVDEHLFYLSTARIHFQNMLVTDRYFYNPTADSFDISRITADKFYLGNFDNAEIYMKWLYQTGTTDIDMEGRGVTDIDFAPSITTLKNCLFNTLTLNDETKSVLLENCQGTLRSVNTLNLTIYNSRLTVDINLALATGGTLHIEDSYIIGTGDIQAGTDFAMLIEQSTIEPSITAPAVGSTDSQTYDIIIKNSTVNGRIEAKKLNMYNSNAGTIKIYGIQNAIGNVILENNVIDNFSFNTITGYESTVSNCVFVNTRIVNNTFNSAFTCPFYVIHDGTLYQFISVSGTHNYLYRGNRGNCPVDSAQMVSTLPYSSTYEGSWTIDLNATVRLFMPGDILLTGSSLGGKMMEILTDYSSDINEIVPPARYGLFHAGARDGSNDYFQMCLAYYSVALNRTLITQINTNGY